jgi:hypothetical protein
MAKAFTPMSQVGHEREQASEVGSRRKPLPDSKERGALVKYFSRLAD